LHHRPQGDAARLHIGEGSLIGMGATLLNGARIGKGCLIGASALVTEGKEIPRRLDGLGDGRARQGGKQTWTA
jgi:carbonic anhydrase/acetyltransferase-like protein (isoleucine patch superfamily)